VKKVSTRFFVKKAPQKTFVLGVRMVKRAQSNEQKFFAELFFKKATAYFELAS